MRTYKNEDETFFNLYLKRRKSLLENTLGMHLSGLVLEKYWDAMKLDLFAHTEHLGRPVMMETWLATSNAYHQRKLLEMTDSLDEGDIVYLAPQFQPKHVKQLAAKVRMSPNALRLSFVKVNQAVQAPLTRLERLNKLDVYGHLLDEFDGVRPLLELVERVESPTYTTIVPRRLDDRVVVDFRDRASLNRYLMQRLRRRLPEFIPVHREKHRLGNRILTYGGGVAGVQYFLTLEDSRGLAFVELRFEPHRRALFDYFRGVRSELRQNIDRNLVFEDGVIAVRFQAHPDVRRTIDEVVTVFSKMVTHLTREVYAMVKNQRISQEQATAWAKVAKFPAM